MSSITGAEKLSIYYHNIFDYPLSLGELIRWQASDALVNKYQNLTRRISTIEKNGNYLIAGKLSLIYNKAKNARASKRKLAVAKRAAGIIGLIPSVKFVGITGALAMNGADPESDIDLMIITKKGLMWTTRLIAYLSLVTCRFSLRSPRGKEEKDKLCLNVWMDESELGWIKRRNIYTAHEIAQIVPIVNKNNTYEKLLWRNKWILSYWPNAVRIAGYKDIKILSSKKKSYFISVHFISQFVEKLAYWIQKNYMKKKITRETITPTRALFHPQDWGRVVLDRMNAPK